MQKIFDRLAGPEAHKPREWDNSLDILLHAIDLKYLLVGSTDLVIAADRATSALAKRPGLEKFHFAWDAPQGRITLNGVGSDRYSNDRPYLLIIDSGGNDTYFGGGATYDAHHAASVLLDLNGNDNYLASVRARPDTKSYILS